MRRVLIVDDHAGFRHMARRMLRDGGYDVVGEAVDGDSGIRQALALQPDVILLDIQLPDRDGCEVARSIVSANAAPANATPANAAPANATPANVAPAIVLISTREAADYGARLERCGALGFLSKAVLSGPALDTLLNQK